MNSTGSSISILDTLTSLYDKSITRVKKKIVVDIFSVMVDISFQNRNTEITGYHILQSTYEKNISYSNMI